MDVITDISGWVPVANQFNDPTSCRRYDCTIVRRCGGSSLCGIESTGMPDLYGEGLTVAESCESPAISMRFSVKAGWDRWRDSFSGVVVYHHLAFANKCILLLLQPNV